jgi:hypothetical protein
MTALASTDVTVSISNRDKDFGHGRLGKNITIADLTFGNGALTYATGGVPLPEIARLGFHKAISFGAIEESADGFVYKFDRANHKLKIFTQGFTTGSTGTAVMENGALVEDSFGAEGNPRISNTAKDTTYDTGQLIELPNGSAPAAATVRMMFVGE